MTVIAYRAGIIAADTGSSRDDAAHAYSRKITRDSDGTLYGTAGNAAECDSFLRWVEDHKQGDPPSARKLEINDRDHSSYIVLVVPIDTKVIWVLTAYGRECFHNTPYFAVGAGAPTAFGALWAGASAHDAVLAAIEHGYGCHGRVQTLGHP